eukprot:gene25569-33383_t
MTLFPVATVWVLFALISVSVVLLHASSHELKQPRVSNIALCIVGQLMRLEIQSKLDNLVKYNAGMNDRKIFVLGILDSGLSYSNSVTGAGGTFPSCYDDSIDIRARFHHAFQVENVTLDTVFSNPKQFVLSNRTLELLKIYRKNTTEPYPLSRIGNHLRQFDHDATCYDRVRALEAEYDMEFDVLMRIRDNAIVTRPIDILKTMRLGDYNNVMTKRCSSWGGYSDKVWIIPKHFMQATMQHVVNLTLSGTEPFLFDPLPVNSESLLKSVWVHYGVNVSTLEADDLPVVDGRCTKMAQNSTSLPHFSRVPKTYDCWPTDSESPRSKSRNDSDSSSPSRRQSLSTTEVSNVKKVVLVTGGAGFIGSHVSDMLLERGDRVVIVDEMNAYYDVRLKHANLEYLVERHGSKVVIYKGDICDLDFISKVFEKERPTHVCHMAGDLTSLEYLSLLSYVNPAYCHSPGRFSLSTAGVRPSILDPYVYLHSNVEGTTRLLDMARLHRVRNFVYASSSSVYGNSLKQVLQEADAAEQPVSPYAATKKACELLAYTFHHLYGLNCTGLRFFTVYGPRGRPDMAPFMFIDRVFRGLPIQQYGDGSTSRDYTYVDDIVNGVVLAIDRPLGYEVINLGNGRPYNLRAFIQLVETSLGKKAVIEVVPEQPGDVNRTCADITKAKTLL